MQSAERGIVNLVQESYGGALVLFLTPVTEARGARRRVLTFCFVGAVGTSGVRPISNP